MRDDASIAGMTIAVTGATGFVGRHVAHELTARGARVRALARHAEKAAVTLPRNAGVTTVIGDVFDRESMRRLCEGAQAVVHLIGIRKEERGATFERMHVEATRRALDACRGAGATRYVQMSALGVRPNAVTGYQTSKFAAEALVRDSGLDWTILRPSMMVGEGGEFVRMVEGWARGTEPPFLFLPYFERVVMNASNPLVPSMEVPLVQPVDVRDVAWVIGECLSNRVSVGEIYPLGGPQVMTWPQMLEGIRDHTPGARKAAMPLGIPSHAGVAMAYGAKALGLASALPFGPSEPLMGSEDNVCSNDKARAHLGFEPSTMEAALDAPAV
ncbi:MAG: NAD(P)H-binding protein [Phycisphaerales bacterium]